MRMKTFILIFVILRLGSVWAQSPKVETTEKHILLNGKPFFIKGVSYSLCYPKCRHFTQIPIGVIEKDFKLMKEAGINTIRTYDTPPAFLLDLALKYNIMVIPQVVYVGCWTRYDSEEEKNSLIEEAVANVKANKHRKNILMWVIWNDAPFVYNTKSRNIIDEHGKEKVNNFLKAIYKAIKKEDPNRPVTGSNMLNFPGSDLGFNFLDVLSLNAYFGITDWFKGKFDMNKAEDMVTQIRNITLSLNKPVLILETGYSTSNNETDQGKIIKKQLQAIGNNFAGVVVFQWADDWAKSGNPEILDDHIEEHWGILDGFRNPKSGYLAIKDVWGK